jgi:hypothetical protein
MMPPFNRRHLSREEEEELQMQPPPLTWSQIRERKLMAEAVASASQEENPILIFNNGKLIG